MQLTALVVDDEPLAREGLRLLLADDADFHLVYEAKDGREAVESIRALRPDLVFLDIQMPECDGLSVLTQIGPDQMPAVVFVTAHDQYAIQAFEINALDYLLKPVTAMRFNQTLQRAKTRLGSAPSEDAARQITQFLDTIGASHRRISRIAVRSAGKTIFVDVDDLEWIEAAENYVQLHTQRGNHFLHVTMNALERSLDPHFFLRIHRSLIINIRKIEELQTATHGEFYVTLQSGARLQSGRNYSSALKVLMTNPF